jgi:hypothetical protein
MAANYWASTQRRHWLFTRERLVEIREGLKEKDKVAHTQFPLPDQRLLNIYFSQRRIYCPPDSTSFELTVYRARQTWQKDVDQTASFGHCPGVYQKILYQKRNTEHKPLSCPYDCILSCL